MGIKGRHHQSVVLVEFLVQRSENTKTADLSWCNTLSRKKENTKKKTLEFL